MKKTGAVKLGETYNDGYTIGYEDGLLMKNQIGCKEPCCVQRREDKARPVLKCGHHWGDHNMDSGYICKHTNIEKLGGNPITGFMVVNKINLIIDRLNSL